MAATKYYLIDTCNDDEFIEVITTLHAAKEWLKVLWLDDDETSEEDYKELAKKISSTQTAAELNEYMAGVGYWLETI